MSNAQLLLDSQTKKIIKDVKNEVYGFYNHTLLDLDAICEHYDIKLLEGEFEDSNQSGALIYDGDTWSIIVNQNHSMVRKRFTIAHELGHFFAVINDSTQAKIYLEEHEGVIRDYSIMNRNEEVEEDSYQIERQANMIAAAILMPDEMVKKFIRERLSPYDMAKEFGVSDIAMNFKLKSMGYESLESVYPN